MWILSLIPDSFLYMVVLGVLISGAALYAISLVLKFIPNFAWLRSPARSVSVILLIIGVYFYGSYDTEMSWRKKEEDAKKDITVIEEKSNDVNIVTKNVYITREKIIKDTQKEIQEKIVEVEKIIDRECKVQPEAISILNQAAKYPLEDKK